MIKKISNNKTAVIILHEIYGINRFIEELCTEYNMHGFDVFCPNMLQRGYFLYSEAIEAYQFFINNVGFDFSKDVDRLIGQLKFTYDKVYIIGFSVGATIAWRCCENTDCDGIICCYGSRIRDYMSLQPVCPVLLLFAEQDSFDVDYVKKQLVGKINIDLYKLQASHGFMDQYSNYYNSEQAQISKEYIRKFLKNIHENA